MKKIEALFQLFIIYTDREGFKKHTSLENQYIYRSAQNLKQQICQRYKIFIRFLLYIFVCPNLQHKIGNDCL